MDMRLIDADKLKTHYSWWTDETKELFDTIINLQPTVDAEPVRHGHWIRNDNGTCSCSECQSWVPNEQYYYARYCLHCGAKMDEVTE